MIIVHTCDSFVRKLVGSVSIGMIEGDVIRLIHPLPKGYASHLPNRRKKQKRRESIEIYIDKI